MKYCNEINEYANLWMGVKLIPFQDKIFDYIFALDILEHVKDDAEALQTHFNLLKANGKLILTVPALMSMWSYNDELNQHYRAKTAS